MATKGGRVNTLLTGDRLSTYAYIWNPISANTDSNPLLGIDLNTEYPPPRAEVDD